MINAGTGESDGREAREEGVAGVPGNAGPSAPAGTNLPFGGDSEPAYLGDPARGEQSVGKVKDGTAGDMDATDGMP